MVRSRVAVIRSYGVFAVMALFATLFTFPVTAQAHPLYEPGYHAAPVVYVEMPMVAQFVVEQVAIAPRSSDIALRDVLAPSGPLKPEYAESYDTHGLNFIDLRRRC